MSTRAISAWLLETHAVKASHEAVAQLLKSVKAARSDAAGAIARQALSCHVLNDLDVLKRERIRLQKFVRRAYASDPELYLKGVAMLFKCVESKLHFAGADAAQQDFSKMSQQELNGLAEQALEELGYVKR